MLASQGLLPIPHPPKKPVVGNLFTLDLESPIQGMMQLTRDLGPIYQLDIMGKPITVVSGFNLCDELCDEKRFDKSVRGALGYVRRFAGDGLFTAYTSEPNWSKAHNILLSTFSHRAMQGYHGAMLEIADQLIMKWARLNPNDEIDVTDDMTKLTLDTIGLCGFGYYFNSFYREGHHPFIDAMVGALGAAMSMRGFPLESTLYAGRERRMAADADYMNKMVDDIIRERRKSGNLDTGQSDMLSAMLSGIDKETGAHLDDVNIRYQIITFLIAGHETTSGMLSFATYYLMRHPDVLAKATAEVDRVLGRDVNARPTYAQVNQLTYVTQILKEALRLWPTAPALGLYPYKDEVIGGQYPLRKNSHNLLLISMLHRDKSIWGDKPEAFNPDHFSREAEDARPANAYKPFGNGQRACIGRQFALHEATLVMGMILRRFRLVDHLGYTLKMKETLTIKPDGFRIQVRARDDREGTRGNGKAVSIATRQPVTAEPVLRALDKHNTPLLVLYGSNLGTSEEIARQMASDGAINNFSVTLAPMDDYVDRLPTEGVVVIVCASYNGTAPDNAAMFYDWLRSPSRAPDSLKGVTYTVFGCGNRDWAATFQVVPRSIDERMAALGARRLFPLGEGDARDDFDGQFQSWYKALRQATAKELNLDVGVPDASLLEPLYTVEMLEQSGVAPAPSQGHDAMPMPILVNRELQNHDGHEAHARSTRHMELQLPPGVTYRAGDHLGVIPRNSDALVRRVAARFGLSPDSEIRLSASAGRPTVLPLNHTLSVGRLLGEYVELQDVATRSHIRTLAQHTECPHTRGQLMALCAEDAAGTAHYKAEVLNKRKSIIDLMDEFPAATLPFALYLQQRVLMAPRYYSISSSPLANPGICSITVGVVEGPARSGIGMFAGVCSKHLADQPEGAAVPAFVKDTKSAFRLPENPTLPVIMVGPGTGLAPFRGFLQERAAMRAAGARIGPSLLFFGCRNEHEDFIYADELRAFERDGVCTLSLAFSRMGPEKTYVQHRIGERQDEVWSLINAGATIYICGDGGRMAPAVRAAFGSIYQRQTGSDEAAAELWLKEMADQRRYLTDVWATG